MHYFQERSWWRWVILAGLTSILLTSSIASISLAQVAGVRDVGNEIHFCINSESILAEFDRSVAQAAADYLLLPAVFHELGSSERQDLLDYQYIPINDTGLLLVLSETCQALVGFRASNRGTPDWVTVTRPYYSTRVVLAEIGRQHPTATEIPGGAVVGARSAGAGVPALARYLGSVPQEAAWRRIALPSNKALVDDLSTGELEAIMIWEPALYAAADGAANEAGWNILSPPFQISNVDFVIALMRQDTYLRTALDEVIQNIIDNGTIAAIARELGLLSSQN